MPSESRPAGFPYDQARGVGLPQPYFGPEASLKRLLVGPRCQSGIADSTAGFPEDGDVGGTVTGSNVAADERAELDNRLGWQATLLEKTPERSTVDIARVVQA